MGLEGVSIKRGMRWSLVVLTCFIVWVVLVMGESPFGYCARYRPAPELNRLAFPLDSDYDTHRAYFGAPSICDVLANDYPFYVPANSTRVDVENTGELFFLTPTLLADLFF
jgi:hypothetical protein